MNKEQRLRQDIVKIGRLLYEKGLICASDGNISARLDEERLLITPSGLHKGMLEPEQSIVVNMTGQIVGESAFKPTSELPMHLEAYRLRPDIKAVVHAHPPIAVALSIANIPLDEPLLPEVIVFLGAIPTTQYAMPSSEENVYAIREYIGDYDGVVLRRHGALTVGDSPMQAFMRMETLEQQARIAYMLHQLGVKNPMPPAEIKKLLAMRQRMGLSIPPDFV